MDIFAEKRILTVTQLTALVRGVLEENFEHVWVEGEVSNLASPSSGHLYFTLKDAGAQIRCVMFRASSRALKFKPRDGMGLILRGRLSVYDQRGEYQLLVEYMEPRGIGALQLAFVQLKERLAREGMFDESLKKPIPQLPRCIGVVTSATGAAIHDILNVLNRRFANVQVLLRPVRVQGEGAGFEIAEAIGDLNRHGRVDVMIVGRGGGSLEDLWAFNEEVVARAIHASRIPVISAVGHETDFTIADFVADLRAPTPSAAAEMVVKNKEELAAQVANLAHRLTQAVRHSLSRRRERLGGLSSALRDPSLLLGHLSQRLDDLNDRGDRAMAQIMARRRDRLADLNGRLHLRRPDLQVEKARERLVLLGGKMEMAQGRLLERAREAAAVATARLETLSPLGTLARGYSVASTTPAGKVVKSSAELEVGDQLDLRFHSGGAVCRVESKRD